MTCRNAIITLAATLAATPLHAAEFIPLGFLPVHGASVATGVSDDGAVVAGSSWIVDDEHEFAGLQAIRWTESTGMVGLGFLPGDDRSHVGGVLFSHPGISGDGSTIVGRSDNEMTGLVEIFIHTEGDGIRGLGVRSGSEWGHAVSFDGSVVVGITDSDTFSSEAFRWTEEEGVVKLGVLPPTPVPENSNSWASDVSDDGSVIVGKTLGAGPGGFFDNYRWTASTGMVGLGSMTGGFPSVSSDGLVVAGQAFFPQDPHYLAYRWTEETGVVGLGWLPGTELSDGSNHSSAKGINGDGSVIVGFSGRNRFSSPNTRAFIWTEESGMQDLQQLLVDQHGLGPSLEGWNLLGPQEMSANGQFIVGVGVNPDGNVEGWLVRLSGSIPEPSSGLLAAASLILLSNRRGRTLRSI